MATAGSRVLALRRAACGIGISILLLVSAGAIEALSFAAGGYLLEGGTVMVLLAGHALLGLVLGGVGAVGAGVLALLAGHRGQQWPLWTVLVPTWSLFCVSGAVLNKLFFPAVASLGGIAANLFLGAVFLLLALGLWRWPMARRIGFWGLVAIPAICLTLAVIMGRAPPPQPYVDSTDDPALEEGPRPSIVLVTVDTLRADHLGAYGYGLPISPSLDELASRSVLFERAYSTSNWTRPSVASLLTSTLPSRHGMNDFQHALPATLATLSESFRRHGYRTAVFAANPNVEREDGYGRGVDTYVQYSNRSALGRAFLFHKVLGKDFEPLEQAIRAVLDQLPTSVYSPGSLTTSAIRWLAEDDGPSFAYLHYVGPHAPYLPPPDLLNRLGGDQVSARLSKPPAGRAGEDALTEVDRLQMVLQYDAEILWHDRELGELFRFLEASAPRRDQVLVVTSDHGEAFGENGIWGHGASLYDEVTRIPLMVWCSRPCGEPRRLSEPVSLLDIAPTLLALSGIPAPDLYEGVNLLPLLEGERSERGAGVVSENPETDERSIRTAEWTLIEGSDAGRQTVQLVANGGAPAVAGSQEWERVRADLLSILDKRLAASRSLALAKGEVQLEQDRIDELRALGYLD